MSGVRPPGPEPGSPTGRLQPPPPMAKQVSREEWLRYRVAGWKDNTGRWVSGVTFFLLLTGLAIFALPFSEFNQHAVVVHTVVECSTAPHLSLKEIFLETVKRGYENTWSRDRRNVKSLRNWVLQGMGRDLELAVLAQNISSRK